VAIFFAQGGCNVLERGQCDDVDTGRFFMRVVFGPVNDDVDFALIRTAFAPIATGFAMDWRLHDASVRPRVLIMLSRQDLCLNGQKTVVFR
jgi:formyltetrahydrofolate deformylase